MGREPLVLRRAGVVFSATVLIVLVVDQVTKAIVRAELPLGRSIPVIEGVFSLTHVRNEGAAFGMLPGKMWLFVGITLLVLASIAFAWWRYRPRRLPLVIALALVTGGALGNLIDRVFAGHVTDFFNVHVWPVFNIADASLDIGVLLLLLWLLFTKDITPDGVAPEPCPPDDTRPGVAAEQ
ncbi:MAG: signal peptidase II [Coriobacteriia bacterium]|nr:signal peptidase II [Marinobacter sp.]